MNNVTYTVLNPHKLYFIKFDNSHGSIFGKVKITLRTFYAHKFKLSNIIIHGYVQ